jgi:hypothetical protein
MEELYYRALELGATSFGYSEVKNKKYFVIWNDKKINFGAYGSKTFLDHGNPKIRDAYWARHSKIKNKRGEYVIYDRASPSFWSANLLW